MQIGARVWRVGYVLVAAAFLAAVARYYHPGTGFTALIEFPGRTHDVELPAVRDAPHYHHPDSGGYDGQFYAQLAVEPLLRDAAIDRAMDNVQYRARRILFSWTAYALGLGRPAWILQVYALQNVVAWCLLGWALCAWMPPATARNFALWSGCLLSYGLLSSVRYALPDGPSTLLIALGVLAAERGRHLLASLSVGLAALARETSILGATMLVRLVARQPRRWLLAGVCILVCLAPLALWMDYLRSIYRSTALAGGDHLTVPLSGVIWKMQRLRAEASIGGMSYPVVASAAALTAFVVQAALVLRELVRSSGRSAWALVGTSFVALALVTHRDVWAGTPGAFTRVFLPVTIAANVLLASRPRASWLLVAAANLAVIPGVLLLWAGWG